MLKLKKLYSSFSFSAFEMLSGGDEISIELLSRAAPELKILNEDKHIANRLKIEALYEHAVNCQAEEVAEMKRDEALIIPKDIDYNSQSLNLSFEEREKLLAIQPQTVSICLITENI